MLTTTRRAAQVFTTTTCTNTKLRPLRMKTAVVYSFAFPVVVNSWTSRPSSAAAPHHFADTRSLSRRFASVVADSSSETNPKSPKTNVFKSLGNEIAEGTVVSYQRGLTAVNIDVNAVPHDEEAEASVLLDPDNAPPSSTSAAKQSSVSAAGDLLGRYVILPNGDVSVVVCHRPPLVFCYNDSACSDDGEPEKVDGTAKLLDSMAPVKIPDLSAARDLFSPIPQVKDIALINHPVLTGITMVDALAPIGRGQNMLLIGHDANDMRGLATDLLKQILTTTTNSGGGDDDDDKDTFKCVYAAIDQDNNNIRERLQEAGISNDVHLVEATKTDNPSTRAAQAVATAAEACATAEAWALQEPYRHTIVVVDTIDQHKILWDLTTRVLVEVFGVDAVVQGDKDGAASSEMRAYYSSLIQRAGQFNAKNGGGSVTLLLLTKVPKANRDEDTVFEATDFEGASDKVQDRIQLLVDKKIPLTAATLQKIDIPIPSESEGRRRLVLQHVDDLISMSDGQIWLDEDLQKKGQLPPLDPQRSITRVGIGADTQSRADAPALRRIVERLRLDLSQAASMDGANMESKHSMAQLRRTNALLLAMHQPFGLGGRRLSQSCVALLAASEGYLDDSINDGALAGTEKGSNVIKDLLASVEKNAADGMSEIDDTLDTSDEARKSLTDAIEQFFNQ